MINFTKSNLLAMAFICLFVSCTTDEIESLDESNYEIDLNLSLETDWEMADEILDLINDYRSAQGLMVIEKDQAHASAFAVKHTKYMIDLKQVNHDNYSERSGALMNKGAIQVGENVAYGYETAENVVFAWINSPSHKDIIEGSFTHSGFGVLKNADGNYFFTLLLYKLD